MVLLLLQLSASGAGCGHSTPNSVTHPSLPPCFHPRSPPELARVVASGHGRVVRFSPGAPPRLCGLGNPNTLALSRALGDNCELAYV